MFDVGGLARFAPFVLAILLAGLILWGIDWTLQKILGKGRREKRFARQLVMLALTGLAFVATLAALPIEDKVREDLLKFLGLVVTVALAFSSTTFVSNAFAGLMLRAVRNFEPGDFVSVGEHFGRVTERGLFHTEIQTEDSDLTTLPNLYLTSNPVKVVRSSGTIVSATVSLGYDIPHQRVEPILLQSAESIGLERPSVRVRDLLDHVVVYRIAGWLSDVTELPFASGRLRIAVLDRLHEAAIEIASPSLHGVRTLRPDVPIIPRGAAVAREPARSEPSAEETAFDKAERAAQVTKLREEVEELEQKIEASKKELKQGDRDRVQLEIDSLTARRDKAVRLLETLESDPEAS